MRLVGLVPLRPALALAHDPAEATRLTAACTSLLERAIRRNPAEWVWMHERWKSQPEAAAARPQAKAVPKSAELSSG